MDDLGTQIKETHTKGVESDGSASESEAHKRFEVTLQDGDSKRRKSSISLQQAPPRPGMKRKPTSCHVHALLNDERIHNDDLDDTINEGPEDKHDPASQRHGSIDSHGPQSRLLTKRELGEMALKIRQMSKRLGHVKLKINVKSIFLLTKAHDETLIVYTREVAKWLLGEASGGPYKVYVENTLEHNTIFDAKGLLAENESIPGRLKFWTNELCAKHPHTFDIGIGLGGDGTVLYTSWLFQRIVPPTISFAMGSLGFLTKFDFGQFRDTLNRALNEGITVSLRLRLEATVMRSQRKGGHHDLVEELVGDEADDSHTHKPEKTHEILNDLVLDRGPNPTMSSLEVFGDDYHLTTIQADGICVATPTGSTAYNLAAGGSLCHPENPVVLLTAICAHTLSFRPIILPDSIVLRLGVPYDARASSWASFDGRERVELHAGDYITISASRFPFPTVLPAGKANEEWIDSLSRTLNWNSRQRQKAFKEWNEKK